MPDSWDINLNSIPDVFEFQGQDGVCIHFYYNNLDHLSSPDIFINTLPLGSFSVVISDMSIKMLADWIKDKNLKDIKGKWDEWYKAYEVGQVWRQMLINNAQQNYDSRMYWYQKEEVATILGSPNHICNFEMRLGKTVLTFGVLKEAKVGFTVVLCPPGLKIQWKTEAELWWPEAKVFISFSDSQAKRIKQFKGLKESLAKTEHVILIIGHHSLSTHLIQVEPLFEEFKDNYRKAYVEKYNTKLPEYMVVDECDYLRNDKGQISKMRKMTKYIKRVYFPYALLLSGTVVNNSPLEIFSLVSFLWPSKGSRIRFVHDQKYRPVKDFFFRIIETVNKGRYNEKLGRQPTYNKVEAAIPIVNRIDLFNSFLRKHMTTRKLKEVKPWLPTPTYRPPVEIGMDKLQREAYNEMATTHLTNIKTKKGVSEMRKSIDPFNPASVDEFLESGIGTEDQVSSAAVSMIRLRQLSLDPNINGHIYDTIDGKKTLLKSYPLCAGYNQVPPKARFLIEYVKRYTKHNAFKPTLIMSFFTSWLVRLAKYFDNVGIKYKMLTGKENEVQKQESKRAFQDGEVDILICNIKAVSKGHTLDRAHTIIFTDLMWSPDFNRQAEARFWPIKAENAHPLNVIHLYHKSSVEHIVHDAVRVKIKETRIVNDSNISESEFSKRLIEDINTQLANDLESGN